jgi:hypothetical protein
MTINPNECSGYPRSCHDDDTGNAIPPRSTNFPVSGNLDGAFLDQLEKEIQNLLTAEDVSVHVSTLVKELSPHPLFLVGGTIRDTALRIVYEKVLPVEDFDFTVQGLTSPLDSYLHSLEGVSKNSMTGFTWKPQRSRFNFDVWPMEADVSLGKSKLPKTLLNFIRNLDFNVNAVAYSLKDHCLLADPNFLCALQTRSLDFQTEFVSVDYITAARAVILARKTGFQLSPRVIQFVRVTANKSELFDKMCGYFEHYILKRKGNPIDIYPTLALLAELRELPKEFDFE